MYLPDYTTTAAAEALDDVEVALFPVGSTEQHGPHLPLSTDHATAGALARSLDRPDVAVLPTLPVGVSEHHRQFDGTLYVSPDTFQWFVEETLASVEEHGVRKAVVVNGHGGNSDAIRRAARSLRREEVLYAAPWNWWDSVEALADDLFDHEGGHADAMETSMMLHVAEDLVEEEKMAAAGDGAPGSWGKTVHGASLGFDTIDFTETGAVGDPTAGSKEAGERLFEAASDELGALVDWLADQQFEDLLPRDHK
ncbi:MAG: creatininase family protein [Halobacteriales archaeon]